MDTRTDTIQRMRARHSIASRRADPYPVTGPWSFRELCTHEHGWRDVDARWVQCRICWWCKPKLGDPPKLEKLPALLKGRVLPPLSGRPDVSKMYLVSGFVIDDDRRSVLSSVRVRVISHPWSTDPFDVRRCGVAVKFKDHGWRDAAVFRETWLHRLIKVLSEAEPHKPRALWRAIHTVMEHVWSPPWIAENWS